MNAAPSFFALTAREKPCVYFAEEGLFVVMESGLPTVGTDAEAAPFVLMVRRSQCVASQAAEAADSARITGYVLSANLATVN